MALLQNYSCNKADFFGFDYQSEWHCSKTGSVPLLRGTLFDYQSEWHCSKTVEANSPLQRDGAFHWHNSPRLK